MKAALAAHATGRVKAFAHITGGGLPGNAPRILPPGASIRLDLGALPRQPVFDWLAKAGKVEEAEMLRTFNCGIGFVAIVAPHDASRHRRVLSQPWREGLSHRHRREAPRRWPRHALQRQAWGLRMTSRKRVGVLISGTGQQPRVADRGGARARLPGGDRAGPVEQGRCFRTDPRPRGRDCNAGDLDIRAFRAARISTPPSRAL